MSWQGRSTHKHKRRGKAAEKQARKVAQPQGIVLVPTRELALQVNDVFDQIFQTIHARTSADKFYPLQCTVIASGEKRHVQRLR